MAWLAGYTTRRKLTVDNTKVDAALTDFPVAVILTSTNFDFTKANADGFDIRFTSSDGETLLKYERERHDNGNSLAEYWVKVPSVASGVDTDIYIYYRTTDTADGADPTAVWDANFKMVQHLKDVTTSSVEDSTGNNVDGTKPSANNPIEADGKIAKGQDFSSDYIGFGNPAAIDITGQITVEAWVKADVLGTYPIIVNKGKDSASENAQYVLVYHTALAKWYWMTSYRTTTYKDAYGTTPSTGTWYYLAGKMDGSNMILIVDGINKYTGSATASLYASTLNLEFGRRCGEATQYWDGIIDEVRISNIARSDAWIKASYNSGNDSLLTYGSEETAVHYETLAVTEVSVVTLSLLKTFYRTLSVVESSVATLSKIATHLRTLAATEISVPALSKIPTFVKTLATTEVSIPTLLKIATHLRTLAATEVSVITLSLLKTFYRILSVAETSVASLKKGLFKTLSAVESSVATLSKVATHLKTLAAIEISVPSLSMLKTFYRTLSATMVSIVSLVTSAIVAILAVINPQAYDGYRCFIEQYVKRKVKGDSPYKLPDGTYW